MGELSGLRVVCTINFVLDGWENTWMGSDDE